MEKKLLAITLFSAMLLIGCSDSTSNANKNKVENELAEEKHELHEKKEGIEQVENEPVYADKNLVLPTDSYHKGDEGEAVLAIQKALAEIGYDLTPSTSFDMFTVWALTDIQLQIDGLHATGIYDEQMKETIQEILAGKKAVAPASQLAKPSEAWVEKTSIENPYEILALVNKSYSLPANYEPIDLTVPNVRFPFEEDDPKKQLRQVAAEALESLFTDAEEEGIHLFALSGYRSYDRQVAIFASNVEKHGEAHANTFSARAGESEHQTGLVMDVTAESVNFDLVTDLGEKEEGIWLAENAHKHGFIIRYPKGKEDITKYQYEPWHLRYVGEKAARDIYENQLTLEEYLGLES